MAHPTGAQPPRPLTLPTYEQWRPEHQEELLRVESNGSIQKTPPTSPISRKKLPLFEPPSIPMQEAPSSPVNVSPPRLGIQQPSPARIEEQSRRSSRNAPTPDSDHMRDSVASLPIRRRQSGEGLRVVDRQVGSGPSSAAAAAGKVPRMREFGGDLYPPEEETSSLQYHAFDDVPKKRRDGQVSQITTHSVGSSSSGVDRPSLQLHVPRQGQGLQRPTSTYTLGSDIRGRTLSPLSANGSDPGSPHSYARDISSSRRSPSSRPISYIDLLNNVPYSQQVAPGTTLNNTSLQSSVGKAASLLDTKKTLEMYRMNVKKTKDLAIQYEFAMFMVNTAREQMLSGEPDSNPSELIKEARSILASLADRAYPFAQYYLGDGYFSGLFNKDRPDYDKAFPLFVAASKHGHAEAGYRAALCYEFGWGTAKSYPKAVQFYRNASSKNHPGAATRLGLACLRGDMGLTKDKYREGIKWLKRAQESADPQYNSAPYELGLLHLTGGGDEIFKDEAYAAQLFTQSAELGHVQASFLMGQAYETGKMRCPRDPALSVHFYNGAAQGGLAEAMMALCAWFLVGAEPVLEKDEAEAYEWAKRAAELDLVKAEYALGYFTEMGIGCRRDPLEANVWYVRAAEKGDGRAQQRLAIISAAASGDSGGGMPMGKADPKSKELRGAKEGRRWKFW